jgi:hypothetical protein
VLHDDLIVGRHVVCELQVSLGDIGDRDEGGLLNKCPAKETLSVVVFVDQHAVPVLRHDQEFDTRRAHGSIAL